MRAHGAKSRTEIVETVGETQRELLALFSSVPEARALRKPAPDEWCLRELALHAAFAERLVGKLVHHVARSSIPPAADLEGAGLGMMPKEDSRSYGEILEELRQANADLLRAVEDLPEEPDTVMTVPHPYFGPLNCLEWAGFQRVHDTDHIRHAGKILASTNT